jgi:histidinol dehydrogenase
MAQWLFAEAADFKTRFGAFLSAKREQREKVDAALCRLIRNAGAILLGSSTPEAIGDYVGGPNHVLPAGRSARFSSGLGVLDFMKRTSILKTRSEALPELGRHAIRLARAEGFRNACKVNRHPAERAIAFYGA